MSVFREADDDKMKKSKGVKSHIVKNRLAVDDFVHRLKNNTQKSKSHKASSVSQVKITLSANGDKDI